MKNWRYHRKHPRSCSKHSILYLLFCLYASRVARVDVPATSIGDCEEVPLRVEGGRQVAFVLSLLCTPWVATRRITSERTAACSGFMGSRLGSISAGIVRSNRCSLPLFGLSHPRAQRRSHLYILSSFHIAPNPVSIPWAQSVVGFGSAGA